MIFSLSVLVALGVLGGAFAQSRAVNAVAAVALAALDALALAALAALALATPLLNQLPNRIAVTVNACHFVNRSWRVGVCLLSLPVFEVTPPLAFEQQLLGAAT